MTSLARPPHGFPTAEFEARLARAQRLMDVHSLDALLVTTPPNMRYFTGFATQFWESPTRPWYLVVPRNGAPIAVVPEIGVVFHRHPDLGLVREREPGGRDADDGVGLAVERADASTSRKFCGEYTPVVFPFHVCDSRTRRSGASKGSGRRSTACTTLNMAALAPMPRASVATATSVKPGARRSRRTA